MGWTPIGSENNFVFELESITNTDLVIFGICRPFEYFHFSRYYKFHPTEYASFQNVELSYFCPGFQQGKHLCVYSMSFMCHKSSFWLFQIYCAYI